MSGSTPVGGPIRALERNIDQAEVVDLLGLLVFEDFEVGERQVAHELTLGVGDDGVDFDVVGARPEGDLRRGGFLRRRRRRLLGGDGNREQGGQRRKEGAAKMVCHAPMILSY